MEAGKQDRAPSGKMASREFTAFVLSDDGHVITQHVLVCETEYEAREQARQLATDHVVTLWEGPRRIGRFGPVK
jgi:hypothetical protein